MLEQKLISQDYGIATLRSPKLSSVEEGEREWKRKAKTRASIKYPKLHLCFIQKNAGSSEEESCGCVESEVRLGCEGDYR